MQLRKWFKDDSGQALAEYGLIIALIAAVAIAIIAIFGGKIANVFTNVSGSIK